MPLTPREIEDAQKAMRTVSRIDAALLWLGSRTSDDFELIGSRIATVIGDYRLPTLTHAESGKTAIEAITVVLLEKRTQVVTEHADVVVLPPPPAALQNKETDQ